VKLQKIVAGKLILDWSPEQISGWLKNQYPEDESLRVSQGTIYRSLFIQARGVLKKELIQHLRSSRRIRRSRHSRVSGHRSGQIADAVSIRERPAEIEGRAIPGHWEGDLLRGTKNSHIATLVERHSRFTALVKVRSKDMAAVVAALSRQVSRLPASLRRSLTWDRGLEMVQHQSFTLATDVKVYFCDPQKALGNAAPTKTQMGCCDSTSLKEPTCLSILKPSSTKWHCVSTQRPRKTLGFETPVSRLQSSVAPTH
jgi:IS30 family transposase